MYVCMYVCIFFFFFFLDRYVYVLGVWPESGFWELGVELLAEIPPVCLERAPNQITKWGHSLDKFCLSEMGGVK